MRKMAKSRLNVPRKMADQTYTPARCRVGSRWFGTKMMSASTQNVEDARVIHESDGGLTRCRYHDQSARGKLVDMIDMLRGVRAEGKTRRACVS